MKLKASFGFLAIFFFNIQGFAQLEDAIRLTLSSSLYSDETIVRFLDDATDSFDADWDAYKLSNGGNTPNFYTEVNQESYTINALHKPFTDKTVSLNLEVAFSGTYTITSEEIGPFDSLCSIVLIDKVLNTSQDLKESSTYSFDFVQGDPSDRFIIEFKMEGSNGDGEFAGTLTSVPSKSLKDNIHIYSMEERIVVEFENLADKVSIGIYDLSGREIFKTENISVSSSNASWVFSSKISGLCIVKILSGNQLYSEKLYISHY